MLSNKALFALLGCLLLFSGARCDEDAADGEVTEDQTEVGDTDDGLEIGAAKDASVAFTFVYPIDANINNEIHAGKPLKFAIGFQNNGEKDFVVRFSEASFRFHNDYNYHIQNFTHGKYDRQVAPKEEATFDYALHVYEQFSGRPLLLVVNLHYQDTEGKYYIQNAFNGTVTVADDDSSYHTETYFMYLIFAIIGVGLLLVGQHFLSKLTRKHGMTKRPVVVEQGTTNKNEVDFEWIPRDVLKNDKKSPKPSSPKPRKAHKAD